MPKSKKNVEDKVVEDKVVEDKVVEDKAVEVVYLEGVENSVVDEELTTLLDSMNSEMELDEARDIFINKANSSYANRKIDGANKRMTYALGIVKTKAKARRVISSKPTMPISVIMRNVGGVRQNYTNVTEDTKDMRSNDDKIGIAGSWRRCLDCGRKWDTADERYGTNCPKCQSTNSVVMANQAVPVGTIGIVNRQTMTAGDISIYNRVTSSVFYYNPDTEDIEVAFLTLTGKQMDLLGDIILGVPFDINVSEDVFVHETTDVKYFSTTGTSKVFDCEIEMPNILDIYDEMPILQEVDELNDGDFATLFLEVVEEAKQPKEGGKWLVQLTEPVEDADVEATLVSMYLDNEAVAKQFSEGDTGIFECRYSEREMTVEGEVELVRTININEEVCGLPVFILADDGVKLISV